MAVDVTREEFESRLGVVEREVEGEKMVTRHILEQTRRNGDDIAAIKTRLGRVEEKVDGLDRKVDGLDRKVDGLDRKVDGLDSRLGRVETNIRSLRTDMPKIVADTMREVLREQKDKP